MSGARDETSADETRVRDEAAAVARRYAQRDLQADAARYGPFDAAALQARQERQRAMLALWRAYGWRTLADRQLLEVGCGSGGVLLELLQCGAQPAALAGIELLPQRLDAARERLPAAVRLLAGDAITADVAAASQDAVLAFTVFSSILDELVQQRLADAMWRWVRPGGGVLVYDFAVDNPRNADVRGVSVARWRALFPQARCQLRRVTLAPPLARAAARRHAALPAVLNLLAVLRTHRLCWLVKTA